ncbi:DUF6544 family protein [Tessaracoccus sp.]
MRLGPEMARAEMVTVFQEFVALAPGAIVDAPVRWKAIDECLACIPGAALGFYNTRFRPTPRSRGLWFSEPLPRL